jgi:hypothetical protein
MSVVETMRRFSLLEAVARITMPGRVKELEGAASAHEDHTLRVVGQ